jgi:hypothetical protein
MNTSVKYTYETAPRNLQELAIIGRFRLKDLAMSLGMGDTPEARSAMASATVEDLAKEVLAQLTRMDAANGRAPAPASAATPAPAPQAPQTPQQPPTAAAPAPAPTKPARQPRTAAAPHQPQPANTAPSAATPTTQAVAIPQELLQNVAQTAEGVTELKAQVAALATAVSNLTALVTTNAADTQFMQNLGTALSLFFAEETLGGSRPEILQAALTDLPDIVAMVGKAKAGK